MKTPNDVKISIAKYGSMFRFEHNACKAQVTQDYTNDDEPVYGITIKHLMESRIAFTYRHDVGLAKSNTHLKAPQCPLGDIPHSQELMEFINGVELKNYSQEKRVGKQHGTKKPNNVYIEELCTFFNKYGYLFPAQEYGKYNKINAVSVGHLLSRIYILANLMAACREYKKNYNKIFYYTFHLIFSEPVSIYYDPDTEVYKTKSLLHPQAEAYHNIMFNDVDIHHPKRRIYSVTDLYTVFPESKDDVSGDYIDSDEEDEYYEKLRQTPVSEEEAERLIAKCKLDTSKHTPEMLESILRHMRDIENKWTPEQYKVHPEDTQYYAVPDYFCRDGKYNFLQVSEFRSRYYEDENFDPSFMTRVINYLYVQHSEADRSIKLVYDFLYHFISDICEIDDINTQFFNTITLKEDINLNRDPRFTQQYKDAICEIAAETIKRELEYAIRDVHPIFDPKTLAPGWELPDLYTTLHYSLFFGNNGQMLYRVCDNPYCNSLFPVPITNMRKKYCSETCRAAVAQRAKRMRDRFDKEERTEKERPEKEQGKK